MIKLKIYLITHTIPIYVNIVSTCYLIRRDKNVDFVKVIDDKNCFLAVVQLTIRIKLFLKPHFVGDNSYVTFNANLD